MAAVTEARAIVADGTLRDGQWKMKTLKLPSLRDDEVLVELTASGICHTDVVLGSIPSNHSQALYPCVLGHEGAGIVLEIGKNVTIVQTGDLVLLSYSFCESCYSCRDGHPGHCIDFWTVNGGDKNLYSTAEDGHEVRGFFFGQSSFCSPTVVKERSVVNVTGLIEDSAELTLCAPFGCGIQTGCASLAEVAKLQPNQAVAVLGLGCVGLAAVMYAKMLGCHTIIGIDRDRSRLELAQELGATHVFDTSDDEANIIAKVRSATEQAGVHVALDTTGFPPLIHHAFEFLRNAGSLVQVGFTPPEVLWQIPMSSLRASGKRILGTFEGDVDPRVFIPKLIRWYKDGKLPMERLVKTYNAEDFHEAIKDMNAGSTVKPVLLF